MRTAAGVAASRKLKVARFSDNMRDVAVTEGDKVEAQIKLGWSVNTYPVGELVAYIDAVTDAEIAAQVKEYEEKYIVNTDCQESVRYQAKMEVGIKKFLTGGGFDAFVNEHLVFVPND